MSQNHPLKNEENARKKILPGRIEKNLEILFGLYPDLIRI